MSTAQVSQLVGSSQYSAVADDALKDEDNAAWVLRLESTVRNQWIERISWIRLADRLAEQEFLHSSNTAFSEFYTGWQSLMRQGVIFSQCPHQEVLSTMGDRWFGDQPDRLSIQAWDRYISAIATYHRAQLTLDDLSEYETMLQELAGSFFQVLPFLSPKYWKSANSFGIVDQFYNNLRDLREDAEQGICYFPTQVLAQFGVTRAEVLGMRCFDNPNYYRMMEFWLNEYLPQLRRRAYGLVLAPDLHPSWQVLRDWSLHRYNRIEQVFRACNFNYALFPKLYWSAVQQDLDLQLRRVFAYHPTVAIVQSPPATEAPIYSLNQTYQASKIARFLNLSPGTIPVTQTLLQSLSGLQQTVNFNTGATI